jgi:hypothetical protein
MNLPQSREPPFSPPPRGWSVGAAWVSSEYREADRILSQSVSKWHLESRKERRRISCEKRPAVPSLGPSSYVGFRRCPAPLCVLLSESRKSGAHGKPHARRPGSLGCSKLPDLARLCEIGRERGQRRAGESIDRARCDGPATGFARLVLASAGTLSADGTMAEKGISRKRNPTRTSPCMQVWQRASELIRHLPGRRMPESD